MNVAVVGSTGFIGESVATSLMQEGLQISHVRAPRIATESSNEPVFVKQAREVAQVLVNDGAFFGSDVIINTAGVTSPRAQSSILYGANAVLPLAIALAAAESGCRRLIHLSSAAVLGWQTLRDETTPVLTGLSTYARSKALGEELLLNFSPLSTVIYRPTSVHGPARNTTMNLVRFASSPLSVCAYPGNDVTPQAHVSNVGKVCAYLTNYEGTPPPTLIHPWEGWTTLEFLTSLGGKRPRLLPRTLAESMTQISRIVAIASHDVSFYARRLQVLMFGQKHENGWLSKQPIKWTNTALEWDGDGGFWS